MTTKKKDEANVEATPQASPQDAPTDTPAEVPFEPAEAYKYTGTAEGVIPEIGLVKKGVVIEPEDEAHARRMFDSGLFEPTKKGGKK